MLTTDIDSLAKTVEMTLNGPVSVLNRMRLACTPIDTEGSILERCAKLGMWAGSERYSA